MSDSVISIDVLRQSLQSCITDNNKKKVHLHLRLFNHLLKSSQELLLFAKPLLTHGVERLLQGDYWLQFEIKSQVLTHEDEVVFRRCLMHFVRTVKSDVTRPSIVRINLTYIDCLAWYRQSEALGKDISEALIAWDTTEHLAPRTKLFYAQNAMKGLRDICKASPEWALSLNTVGLKAFINTFEYRQVFEKTEVADKHKVMESSLLALLSVYLPEIFNTHIIEINHKIIDVTDLHHVSPICVRQLAALAKMPKYTGGKEHDLKSVTQRFIGCVFSLKLVFSKQNNKGICLSEGLDAFKNNEYSLLLFSKGTLSRFRFNELLLFLGDHYKKPIHRHDYQLHLFPFYFEKTNKFRTIDFSTLAGLSKHLFEQVRTFHQVELSLLPEKNYSMETLHTRFNKLNRLLVKYLFPAFDKEVGELGLACLSTDNNRIQKLIFQQIQSSVQAKQMSLRTGTSYFEVIRWVMGASGQQVVEAFGLSFKRYQRHAKRTRIEDLYTEGELRELVFYIESGIKSGQSSQRTLALYFAKIQLKTCWNTAPLTDIEVSDITEIALPTAKKSISVLVQKPRKGYDIDCYNLDGRTVNSVMRDIQTVKNDITQPIREGNGSLPNKCLFIYREKAEVYRLDHKNVISYINAVLKGLGCRVSYNSMRIRKNGANHIYRKVAKDMRAYESHMRHDFDTFIKHYQRIDEIKTQQTLHEAVDVMQRYFTGREISPEIKVLMIDDASLQKTPTGECASAGNDDEAEQYQKEHRALQKKTNTKSVWCSDFLACIWCKHFRTVADPEHVWQLLSYRDYVLVDMSASVSDIENNEFQTDAIQALHDRVGAILTQVTLKNKAAVTKGQQLLNENGMHPFWDFAITSTNNLGGIL
ncbi:hypothetical protein [Alkalimarinus alittae]|uniref:Uncharacterized protein n=1 Tax=Alkalimarinus alittae TaxID=2961619 RepID=A0ABY6N680_9ALTE|nr:hypothetical protein [Alkalimarinus alittae]UZE97633.1 hypothetical protein NKI27_07830 [Alkalimarinus alittae]